MTHEHPDSVGTDQQPVRLTVFHLLGLIAAVMVAFSLVREAWRAGGLVGALGGVLLAVLLVPIAFAAVTVLTWLTLAVLVYIAYDELPVGPWMRRLRTILRFGVIVGCVAWFAHAVPALMRTTTWKELYDAALWGVLGPFSTIFFLFISRLEKPSLAHEPGKTPEPILPPNDDQWISR